MELIEQYQKQPAASVIPIRFPWYVSLALFMLTGSAAVVIGLMLAAHREIPNPFSVYNDLFGDNARQAASARGFTCRDMGLNGYPLTLCTHHNTEKLFSRLYVWISGDRANEISFSLRDNTLRLGDLALLWGKPEIRLYCETFVALWPARHIMGVIKQSRTGQVNYFLPILSVYFTTNNSSRVERVFKNDALNNCE